MTDSDYRSLQESLVNRPDLGSIIKGSGGLRKLRWKLDSKGKRGGIRLIYYWLSQDDQLFMLCVYPKNKQENLTEQQLTMLKSLVETW